jgi:serine/threonine-protein kinase HipA
VAYEPVNVIEVRCWGQRVGAVALDDSSGFYAFEYDERWRQEEVELAPLTMPLSARGRVFVFPTLPIRTYRRLPALIADSLPDDFGNALTNAFLAAEGVSPDAITPLDRLAYLGQRAIGALEFRPTRGPRTRRATAIELSQLVTTARAALQGNVDDEGGISRALADLIAVGTSAGGARAKAVVALNPNTNELRSGQVQVPEGFEHWILKFDGVGPDIGLGETGNFGRIEFAYSLMAREAGVRMTECRLLEEGGRTHFMTRRFDRGPGGEKVHIQSLCSMAEMDFRQIGVHDYSQLFVTLDDLGLGPDARAEIFRRMVFNVAAANRDDHPKNFAFILHRDGEWALSPAYDVTHAHASQSEWTRNHLMAVSGRRADIARSDLAVVGDRFAVPAYGHVIDQVLAAVSDWPKFADQAELPASTAGEVQRDIEICTGPLR